MQKVLETKSVTYVNFFSLFQFVIQLFDLCIIILESWSPKKVLQLFLDWHVTLLNFVFLPPCEFFRRSC